jgi:hypothetical protein
MAIRSLMALAVVLTRALTALPTEAAESWAARHGPQFLYLWTEEDCFVLKMALMHEKAVPWKGLLEGNVEMQERRADIIAKLLYSPQVAWVTEQGDRVRRHIQLTLPQQILTGFALTRYYCQQEDEDTDPGLCNHLNMETQRLFQQIRNPSARTFGGNDGGVPPWIMLEQATRIVPK